jgi:carbon monoxide dehydrogenase subunit G
MDMQGSRTLPATQEQTWAALNDPEMLKACVPGCEKFEAGEENQYLTTVAVRIGPVAARFNGRVTLADINPPHSYALRFDAQGGVAGFGKGEAKVSLAPAGSGCELSYSVHSQVGGKLAQIGQRLVDAAAKSLADDFFTRFEAALLARHPSADQPAGSVPAADSSEGWPAWLWACLAAAAAAGVFALTR